MASVYCASCKAKITREATTCPSCGSPTSRVIPVIMFIAVASASLLLYGAYQQYTDNSTAAVSPDLNFSRPDAVEGGSRQIGLNEE